MSSILFVTWDGGGNVPPALGIARELAGRGHTVRFLGHASQQAALTAAGVEVVPARHSRDLASRGRYSPLVMLSTFADRGVGRDLLDELARRPADLVVIDGLMFGALQAALDTGVRYAVLEHMYDAVYRGFVNGPPGLALMARGLRPRRALAGAQARVLTTAPSLDPVPRPPANLRQVGPVVEVRDRAPDTTPLVLVSLSTFGFPGMQPCLQSVIDATSGLDARVVVTTGPAIDPASVRTRDGVEVHRFVPHAELMPRASLVVGHGGHGTTMQALAHDLPVVVMPMDRMADQPKVGRSLELAGAGRVVRKGAPPSQIAPVVEQLLADGPHRRAAAELGREIRSMPGATRGADVVEELLATGSRPLEPH